MAREKKPGHEQDTPTDRGLAEPPIGRGIPHPLH